MDHELGVLVEAFYHKYKLSLGLIKNQQMSPDGTLKAHQLYKHLVKDIKGGGLKTNYDAQAGESHHVQTRAHFQRSSKRQDAEEKVEIRSATRELGVLGAMYPLKWPDTQGGPSGTVSDSDSDSNEYSSGAAVVRRSQRKLRNDTPTLVDGKNAEEFTMLLKSSYPGESSNFFRRTVRQVKVIHTVRIQPRFPWIPEDEDKEFVMSSLNGLRNRLVRAASTFYGEHPRYDFVEIASISGKSIGQVRLIFEHPFPLTASQRKQTVWAQVRFLARVTSTNRYIDNTIGSQTHSGPCGWSEKISELYEKHGCIRLRWDLAHDGRHIQAIICWVY